MSFYISLDWPLGMDYITMRFYMTTDYYNNELKHNSRNPSNLLPAEYLPVTGDASTQETSILGLSTGQPANRMDWYHVDQSAHLGLR
jgi:hypothetical protein